MMHSSDLTERESAGSFYGINLECSGYNKLILTIQKHHFDGKILYHVDRAAYEQDTLRFPVIQSETIEGFDSKLKKVSELAYNRPLVLCQPFPEYLFEDEYILCRVIDYVLSLCDEQQLDRYKGHTETIHEWFTDLLGLTYLRVKNQGLLVQESKKDKRNQKIKKLPSHYQDLFQIGY